MFQKIIILTFMLLFKQATFQHDIFDTEADQHIGESLTVSGKVNTYKILNSRTILLFCGSNYPRKYFTVIVKNRNEEPNDHPNLIGWNIYVTGLIIKYKGNPAIKVPNWKGVHPALFVDHVPNDL